MHLETRKRDLFIGIGFLFFSIGVWIASFSIKRLVVSRIGSAFVPQLAASLLGILSIILIAQSVASKSKAVPSASQKVKPEASAESRKRVLLTFLLILLYLALLESVGFLITTAFYLFFQILVLSRKKPNLPLYGLIAVFTSLIVYYLFVKVFILFLPAGILG